MFKLNWVLALDVWRPCVNATFQPIWQRSISGGVCGEACVTWGIPVRLTVEAEPRSQMDHCWFTASWARGPAPGSQHPCAPRGLHQSPLSLRRGHCLQAHPTPPLRSAPSLESSFQTCYMVLAGAGNRFPPQPHLQRFWFFWTWAAGSFKAPRQFRLHQSEVHGAHRGHGEQ